MGQITLVTGGARSGKSSFALSLAEETRSLHRVFIASAVALDQEMRERIHKHQNERGGRFKTVEAPYDPCAAINGLPEHSVAILDCLTVWLGNVFHKHGGQEPCIAREIDALADCLAEFKSVGNAHLIMVTNEIGWGIVPADATTRLFRDTAGRLNARIAVLVDAVHLCACGIPLRLK